MKGENGKTLDMFCQRFVRDCWTFVLKFYLKGRLDCDDGNAVSSALLHVCMSVYSGNLGMLNYTITLS